MPLPEDEAVITTSKGLLDVFHRLFGQHPGFRPAHAKGILLKGHFKPTETAGVLSKAPHFTKSEGTPVIARFSDSTGIPSIPDTDPNASPRGFAVRFVLEESPRRVHTDIVSHSTSFFPARDGPSTLEVFTAIADGTIGSYLGDHPAALAFVQDPKPMPETFANEKFFGVNAFKLISADGKATYVRYRFVPAAGTRYLDDGSLKSRSANYLFDSVPGLLEKGPIIFNLNAQVAAEGDVTDDCTVHWPPEREVVKLGTVTLEALVEDDAAQQKYVIFDPVPRVDGIEASDDPLIDVRAAVYLISGRDRRKA